MLASTWRYIFAVFGLLIASYYYSKRVNYITEFELARKHWIAIIFISLTGIFLFNYFFFKGLTSTLAVNGSLIVAMNPAITFIISVLFLKAIIRRNHVIGIIVSLIGAAVVIFKGNLQNIVELSFFPGDVDMFIATTLFALHHIIIQRYIPTINAFVLTLITSILGLLLCLLFMGNELIFFDYSTLDLPFWLSIICMGFAGTTFSFVVWNVGIMRLGASSVSMFLNLVPAWAAVTGLLFGKEIALFQLFGGALIILGIYITRKKV